MTSSTDSGGAAPAGAAGLDLGAALARASEARALSGCDVRRIEVPEPAPIDAGAALRAALAAPVGSAPLAELARGAGSVAIVTSDATRAVPNRELLPPLLDELARGGVGSARVTVVFGGGAHRPVTADEAAWMLGPESAHLRWVAHDARRSDCVSVGATPRGNDVLVNRVVADAGLVIALGVCEAHEFAGFSGGRKAILPAVAGYDSILRNHAVGLMSHPQARPGVLEGNPIHEEMLAGARLARLRFIVNVTLDDALRPVALTAGDPEAAHSALVEKVEAVWAVDVAGEDLAPGGASGPDLIVTGPGRPLDINLYQSIKCLVAVEPLVGRETVVVLVSACREGTGSDEMLLPFDGASGPDEALRRVMADYTVEKDHSYFIARFLARCPNVIALCPGVEPEDLSRLGFEPARDLEDALGRARRRLRAAGARPRVLLFPRPQRAILKNVPPRARPAAGPSAPSADAPAGSP